MVFTVVSNRVQVYPVATVIFLFQPRDMSLLKIDAEGGNIWLGAGGITSTRGFKLRKDASIAFTHQDFSPELLEENPILQIYGWANPETYCKYLAVTR